VKFIAREEPGAALTAAYEALGAMRPFAKKIVPRLAKRLKSDAKDARERIVRRRPGVYIDPRTGDVDTSSEKGRAHMRHAAQRAEGIAAMLRALDSLGGLPVKKRPDLTPFLQDASDVLVVETLRTLAAWDAWQALPAVLDLYRMYPTERSWSSDEHVHSRSPSKAQVAWLAKFGHPDKRRPRPEVVEALRDMLRSVTGETFESPAALAAYLERIDTRRPPSKAASR
jgi:hypothetical protein